MTTSTLSFILLAAGVSAGQTADDLFDTSYVHEIRLFVHPNDWTRLKKEFQENTYFPAELHWKGLVIENIAIRSRGGGSRNAEKPGLRVDFNRYEPEQEFLGLKSVVLDNMTQDPPMAREYMSMALFRRMGLAAPRESHTRLYVNGKYAGLYAIVEPVDKRFLERTLQEDSGYLYEYQWSGVYDFGYRGDDVELYSPYPFEPKTNEKNPQAEVIVEFVRTVSQSSDEEFAAKVGEFVDWNQFLTYLAVESFVGETDGFTGEVGVNNLYVYRFKNSKKFYFIPWDKDATFSWTEQPVDLGIENNILARRALATPALRAIFVAALQACAEAADLENWFEAEARRVTGMIFGDAKEDTSKPYTPEDFDLALETFLYFISGRSQFVRDAAAVMSGSQ